MSQRDPLDRIRSTLLDIEDRRSRRLDYQRRWRESQRERLRIARAVEPDVILAPRLHQNPQYWEAPDGWHAAYLVWRVGPCADYTAAAMALREAMCLSAWDIAFAVQL